MNILAHSMYLQDDREHDLPGWSQRWRCPDCGREFTFFPISNKIVEITHGNVSIDHMFGVMREPAKIVPPSGDFVRVTGPAENLVIRREIDGVLSRMISIRELCVSWYRSFNNWKDPENIVEVAKGAASV